MRLIVNVGDFVTGEVPAPLEYQYLDAAGVPLNLTGYGTVTFQWSLWLAGMPFLNPVSRVASVSDALNGVVTYVWQGDEFASTGRHAGMFFAGNGTNRYASLLLEWQVCASVAAS